MRKTCLVLALVVWFFQSGHPTGADPLPEAAQAGALATVKGLLAQGAYGEAQDGNAETPLPYAALQGDEERATLLLVHGANIHARGHAGETPLYRAVLRGHTAMVELPRAPGASLEGGKVFSRVFLEAWRTGSLATIKALLAQGANVTIPHAADQRPPLPHAVPWRDKAVVELLLGNRSAG